jgi:hypothetical protein
MGLACSDPVHDNEVAALGPEDANGPGPDHRPGQPCLVCHSHGGAASSKAFAVAGTIYETADAKSKGCNNATVQFVDARGAAPAQIPTTTTSGNFHVLLTDWPDMAFPLRVALYKDETSEPQEKMQTFIGREGSCNFCHKPFPTGDVSDQQADQFRSSIGQIFYGGPCPKGGK